ncbi:signal transduction histidine kinase [Yimella lutea]|uniref:histidine kinase n=1 Tax=Yimella lutea TaxID=587872 RepID=A0A542EBV0_9MICO|nr:sensor histidine kinase [Yimella lutea]TQJ12764.1 signal transduction histidine kinase [Yimella lutea]
MMSSTAPHERSWRRVRTTSLVIVAFFSTTLAIAYNDLRRVGATDSEQVATTSDWTLLAWLVGVVLGILLIWRRRWPWQLFAAYCVATIALPIDGFLPLAGLFTVLLIARRREHVLAAIAAASLAVAVSVYRDVTDGVPEVSSFWRLFFRYEAGVAFPWWLIALITTVLVAVVGLLVVFTRNRRALDTSTLKEQIAHTQIDRLSEEVARRAERERIAREVHDALGHRLSLLNLHAGALEMAAGNNPKLAQSARVVRESAQQSMADLRSLLGLLREPGDPDVSKALLTLSDLPGLIDESLAAGSPVASSIFIDESAPLDEQVSHTVFRITQELLTNSRRHSPGAPIRLHLDARPARGIEISTTNRLRPGAASAFRPGNGLTGIHERVTRCGGESWAWVDDDAFRVLVRLPWQFRPAEQKVGR